MAASFSNVVSRRVIFFSLAAIGAWAALFAAGVASLGKESPRSSRSSATPASTPAKAEKSEKGDKNHVAEDADPEGDRVLLDLFKKNRLFRPNEYATIRSVFAKRFERRYASTIRRAIPAGSPAEKLLKDNPAIREELFLAIDPAHDDPLVALAIFAKLVEDHPKRFPAYAHLAIATAVTWDRRGVGVYDYVGHQIRTKTTLPGERIGPLENFQYLVDNENVMQGRVQYLPWEFLVHVVNHRTPLTERRWAMTNYLPKRVNIGECYRDIRYDDEMRDTKSRVARLNGHVYDLPTIRQYGGVCAMQADFASRVAKSLGVPAEYVGGESRGGQRHAWVMWVELLAVTSSSIQFELKSHGRYLGDCYYVGELLDPKTGQRTTDRQLELRLQTVGLNPQNKRHASLIMRAYPMLRDETKMDVADELRFLERVIRLCPGNEDAWLATARMSKEGRLTSKHEAMMLRVLNGLFTYFAKFPDFTWEVFDDLVACQKSPEKRGRLYEQLVSLYVRAKRPDLACLAVLKQADHLIEQKRYAVAMQGLANTILAFPDEGRYVPKMLDKLESVAGNVPGADQKLLDFYQTFLPKVPKLRGTAANPYCVEMYERAIARFSSGGRAAVAAFWSAELARLKN